MIGEKEQKIALAGLEKEELSRENQVPLTPASSPPVIIRTSFCLLESCLFPQMLRDDMERLRGAYAALQASAQTNAPHPQPQQPEQPEHPYDSIGEFNS